MECYDITQQLNEVIILNFTLGSTVILMIAITFFSLRYAVRQEKYFQKIRSDRDFAEYQRQSRDPRLQEVVWCMIMEDLETSIMEYVRDPEIFPNPLQSKVLDLITKYTIIENETI